MHPDTMKGAVHWARVAGKPVPTAADISAATRTHAEQAFEAVAGPLAMRNAIATGARHFAGCVAQRDQVRGITREKAPEPTASQPVAIPAQPIARGQRTVMLPRRRCAGYVV